MNIEVKDYTYETMPDYDEQVEGMKEIKLTGQEVSVNYINDVVYDRKSGTDLHLQILVPYHFNKEETFPCVVFVKGSAWKKQNIHIDVPQLSNIARRGYVTVIVECRDSSIAHFPAHIIDAKNAIRYMKAHCEEFHINKDQIIIMGGSSGGHTSAMIGCTAYTDLFDDPINNEKLNIKGCIDVYGAVEPTLTDGFPTTLDHGLPTSPEGMYLGYNIRENIDEAKKADVKNYVQYAKVPFFIMHGSKDKTVFAQESVNLYEALKRAGKDVTFYLLRGSDHGGPGFFSEQAIDLYDQFIKKCLK